MLLCRLPKSHLHSFWQGWRCATVDWLTSGLENGRERQQSSKNGRWESGCSGTLFCSVMHLVTSCCCVSFPGVCVFTAAPSLPSSDHLSSLFVFPLALPWIPALFSNPLVFLHLWFLQHPLKAPPARVPYIWVLGAACQMAQKVSAIPSGNTFDGSDHLSLYPAFTPTSHCDWPAAWKWEMSQDFSFFFQVFMKVILQRLSVLVRLSELIKKCHGIIKKTILRWAFENENVIFLNGNKAVCFVHK